MKRLPVYKLTDYQRKNVIEPLYFGMALRKEDFYYSTVRGLRRNGWITINPMALTELGRASYKAYLDSPNRQYTKVKNVRVDKDKLEHVARMAQAALIRMGKAS